MIQFSTREVALVTLSIAIGLGWWVDHFRGERARKAESLERGIEAILLYFKTHTGRDCVFLDEYDNQLYGEMTAQNLLTTRSIHQHAAGTAQVTKAVPQPKNPRSAGN